MKTKSIVAASVITLGALSGLFAIGIGPFKEKATLDAKLCIELRGDSSRCDQVEARLLEDATRASFEKAMEQRQAIKARQAKKEAEDAAIIAREQEERAAKAAQFRADAEAKFKAEGWMELQPGIYGRWCTETCDNSSVIGDASYWLMEVWAKDRAAGDVYAQINIVRDGVIVGWTNDTAYIDYGQRAVLTFSKHGLDSGGKYTAEIVKFNARG